MKFVIQQHLRTRNKPEIGAVLFCEDTFKAIPPIKSTIFLKNEYDGVVESIEVYSSEEDAWRHDVCLVLKDRLVRKLEYEKTLKAMLNAGWVYEV